MTCKKKTSEESYIFLRNSHYYWYLLKEFDKCMLKDKRENVCGIFLQDINLSGNSSAKEICEKFMYIYENLNKIHEKEATEKTITDEDCHFINYWLNVNLKKNNIDSSICVNEFYEKLKSKNTTFFSSPTQLEKHLHVIDPSHLKNMEILYKLYDNAVEIKSIIDNEVYTSEEEKNKEQESCAKYTKECDENYKEAMDRCLNSNDNFYNALKTFKDAYDIITKPSSNESNACKSSKFSFFPKYDPVSEKEKEKRIMTIKISSTLSVLSLVLPLIYKYTPFGPFLRTKISMVRNRWLNQDKNESELLLLSTDTDDYNSENGEYNIGYYSETN
ncbi:PIR Superfamily Protein [Plasmodium ovale curtisi]|uniref:PIR Superfamily Protein n=1 Tax=Plasmodium ovale curtisi TaxID=864141 RepID=A0A1A8WQ91_PLAOA|nr:PIR Superfamily Protein [Plasmodium ovale curtisi]